MRWFTRVANPVLAPLAGKSYFPLWAVLHHRGRVSGREYHIPVVVVHTAEGFVIPMPFGSAQWPLNVMAAGRVELHWKGRDYIATGPQMLGPEGGQAFNFFERSALGLFGIRRFMRLRVEELAGS